MAALTFLTNGHPSDEICHHIFAHFRLNFTNNRSNFIFKHLNRRRSISIDLIFHIAPKEKKSNGVKSKAFLQKEIRFFLIIQNTIFC